MSDAMQREVFVAGVPAGLSEAGLRNVLERFGPVEAVSIKKGKATGRGLGDNFAFVLYHSSADAARAVSEAAARKVRADDAKLTVRWSQNSGGGGGGGSGGGGAGSGSNRSRGGFLLRLHAPAPPVVDRPGPNTRGWQCRDPSCHMWNEDVSPACVQCNLARHPSQRHPGFGSWKGSSPNASFAVATGATNSSNVSSFPLSSYASATSSAAPAGVAGASPVKAGRGRGMRKQAQRQEECQVKEEKPPPDVQRVHQAQKDESERLQDELQRARFRCNKLEKELCEVKKQSTFEEDMASVFSLRQRLHRRRQEADKEQPSTVVGCIVRLLEASEHCFRNLPKIHDQVRKGLNYYKSFSPDCDDGEEAEMNRLARDSAAKALSVSVAQYLSLFPAQEVSEVGAKVDDLSTKLLEDTPWLRIVGPKPLDGDNAVKALKNLRLSDSNYIPERCISDEACGALRSKVEKLAEALGTEWSEHCDLSGLEASLQRTKEVMELEEKKWKNVNLAAAQEKQLKDLFSHLFWCRQRLAHLRLQYKDVYKTAEQLEKDHNLVVIDRDLMDDPENMGGKERARSEEEGGADAQDAAVVVVDDGPDGLSDGGDQISVDDNLSDVLTFSDEDQDKDDGQARDSTSRREEKQEGRGGPFDP